METVAHGSTRGQVAGVVLVGGSIALLAAAVVGGGGEAVVAAVLLALTALSLARPGYLDWSHILAVLIAIILLVPIRRYSLPGSLPFELEPYRVFIALLFAAWCASLLVDGRTRLRRTGFEGPLALIVIGVLASIVANPTRIAESSAVVNKSLTFFLSFIVLVYVLASVVRTHEAIDTLVRTLVLGGTVVALFAIVEARTGFNIFNHLHRAAPVLQPTAPSDEGGFLRFGAAKLRVFGSAEHPIALSAALVMLVPLALYLYKRDGRRRWILCATALAVACSAAVSRTGIVMFVVIGLTFLWLRPREMRRMWPLIIPALIVLKLLLPGTLGAIKQSFLPAGGLIAEQKRGESGTGSGRLADLGPGLQAWERHPFTGQGFATAAVIRPHARTFKTNILDNQWLTTLLTTGAIGFFGWLWFFVRAVRRFKAEAKKDDSDRAWLFAALTAGVAAYGVGMLTYDAFAFPQVTFLLFIFAGIGAGALAERSVALAIVPSRSGRRPPASAAPGTPITT